MGRAPGEMSRLVYQLKGIAAVIAPWNFPLAISCGMSSAAIVTGNLVLYKPAGPSSVVGFTLAEIFRKAGLPDGVFNYVPGRGSVMGDYLVEHPDIEDRKSRMHVAEVLGQPAERLATLSLDEAAGRTWQEPNMVLLERMAFEFSTLISELKEDDPDNSQFVDHLTDFGPRVATAMKSFCESVDKGVLDLELEWTESSRKAKTASISHSHAERAARLIAGLGS